MKRFTTWMTIAALAAVPIGCDSGPGTSGENPGGDGSPIQQDDNTGDTEGGMGSDDVMKMQGEGGDADPLAPTRGGGPPPGGGPGGN